MSGFNLDGNAASQQKKGISVPMWDLKPGDLVFHGKPATHVGIYVGDDYVLAASGSAKQVKLSSLHYFDSARRVFDDKGRPLASAPAPKPAPPVKPVVPFLPPWPFPSAPTVPTAPPASGVPTTPVTPTYTVRPGDTLWKIAQTHLGSGSRWREIYAVNTDVLGEPNSVVPGMKLKLPSASPLGGGAPATAPNPYFNDH
jgi:nucleoid-associated protein YgaU